MIYEDLELYKKYVQSRIMWLISNFNDVIEKRMNVDEYDRKIQEIHRDCLIMLRRLDYVLNKYPLYMSADIREDIVNAFKDFRYRKIPQFVNYIETQKRK